jgi:hypothetical protein
MSGITICQECGMPCTATEFHPFAACLMFKGCHDSDKVRANLAALTSAPAVPEAFTFGMEKVPATLTVVAHAATDWMRSITETELALIPNVGADGGRRDCCRQLYRIPLVRLTGAQSALLAQAAEKDAEIQRLRALLSEASTLLKRSPTATMDMYTGRDRKSFGAQAKELSAAIDSARALAKQEEKS